MSLDHDDTSRISFSILDKENAWNDSNRSGIGKRHVQFPSSLSISSRPLSQSSSTRPLSQSISSRPLQRVVMGKLGKPGRVSGDLGEGGERRETVTARLSSMVLSDEEGEEEVVFRSMLNKTVSDRKSVERNKGNEDRPTAKIMENGEAIESESVSISMGSKIESESVSISMGNKIESEPVKTATVSAPVALVEPHNVVVKKVSMSTFKKPDADSSGSRRQSANAISAPNPAPDSVKIPAVDDVLKLGQTSVTDLKSSDLVARSASDSAPISSVAPSIGMKRNISFKSNATPEQPRLVKSKPSDESVPSNAPRPASQNVASTASAATHQSKPESFSAINKTVVVNSITYLVLEQIGKGGTSTVYKVMGPKSRLFACKIIKLSENDAASCRNEVKLLQRLFGKPNIIQLFAAEEKDGCLLMVCSCV